MKFIKYHLYILYIIKNDKSNANISILLHQISKLI